MKQKLQKFDNSELNKDLDVIFKKHGIKFGFLVAPNYTSDDKLQLLTIAEYPDKKKEKEFAGCISKMFMQLGFDMENLTDLTELTKLLREQERTKAKRHFSNMTLTPKITKTKHEMENEIANKMSEEDFKKLQDIQEQKNILVKSQKYEEACKLREQEVELYKKYQ